MSTESLAARLGRILTKNPESDGILDEQVEEFLSLYDQVPSSVKADKEQLKTLLDRSRNIARQCDDYDMPHLTVNVQGFKFNPPSIQSELPCQLQFRVLPGTGKQIISVQDASSKSIATSGLLDPQLHNTFTTTICNPGSYAFTSEIYPFMAGQLIARSPATLADAASGDDAEQPVATRKPLAHSGGSRQLAGSPSLVGSSNQLTGSKPLPNSNISSQLAAKGQPQQQPDQYVPLHTGRQDVGDADVSSGASGVTAARSFKSVSFEVPLDHTFVGRVSDAASGLSNQPSETGMLELLSLPGDTLPHEQQHPVPQHISYQGELSRAGSFSRRATLYDDELDGQSKGQSAVQQGSNSIVQDAVGAADMPTKAQHISYQGELSRAGPLSRRATKYGDELGREIDAAISQHESIQAGVQEPQPTPAAMPHHPSPGHTSYEGELSRAGKFARRATQYDDGFDLAGAQANSAAPDSREPNTHAGFTAAETILQHPQQTQQQHVSYQGELSRAGRFARRATQYDDELDQPSSSAASTSRPSDPTDNPVTAVAPPATAAPSSAAIAAPASNHCDSNMTLQSAVTAAAAATSAAHGGGSVCSSVRTKPLAAQGMHRDSSHDTDGPVDMDVDEPQQRQQQQVAEHNAAPLVSLIGFAKGLEGLEASLRFSPEPVVVAASAERLVAGSVDTQASAEGFVAESVDSHASAAIDADGMYSSHLQQQQQEEEEEEQGEVQSPAEANTEVDDLDQASGSSMGSISCMYEPLASNSEQHSSASSQADSTDSALRVSDDDRQVSSWFQCEGQNLLGDRTDRDSRPGHRRTWVDAAAAAMEDSGPGTWAHRRSVLSSESNSPSDGDQSESDDSAGDDVRLRTVRQQHWQQQHQDDVLQLEDVDDEDVVVDASATRTVGRAVQTELPPIRRPYRGLTAADAIANSAAARSSMLSSDLARQEPPGGRWTLGSRASFAAGSGNSSLLRSTFTSTGDGPGPGGNGSGSSRWVVTGGLSSGAQHSSLQQATAAAAANAEQTFKGVNGSYFDKHVLGRNNSNSTATKSNSNASLGPGTYVLSSKGSSSTNVAHSDEPTAQYAAIIRDRKHSSQLQTSESSSAAAADSDEDPPELRVRTQRLLQQQAAAAAAAARSDSQQQDTALQASTRTSNSTAIPAPAAAATTKAAAASRKKKGRKAALSAAGAAADGARDKSAADARRREREEIEYALYQRGAGSRADSEDDTSSTHLRPSRLSSAAAAASSSPDEGGLSSTAEAARQLTKCRFKGCKLMFASDLNKHRCQMSHLPSARNTTTKPYKAEVLAFLRALPDAAVAQILQLPEPSQLPRRQVQLQQLIQQHSKTTKGISAAGAAAGSSIAAAIERLQGMGLSDAWIEQSTVSDSGAVRRQGDLLLVSELAQLCCGGRQGASSPSEDVEDAEQQIAAALRQQQDGAAATAAAAIGEADAVTTPVESSAAVALAAAHAELLHGVCCSSCTAETRHDAGRILECSCRCHPAAMTSTGLLQHQQLAWIIAVLDRASEGTFLANPRLLQQQHTPSCCCSVCVGIVTAAGSSSKSSGGAQRDGSAAVMESISCGLDILDIFGEWNVDDASLSYAVERRLVTAFHRAKDAEARRVMAQLLEDTQLGSSSQQLAGAAATKKKDKKKAAKAAKPGSKKVPAWKAVSTDQYSSAGSDGEQSSKAVDQAFADSTAVAAAAAGAWDLDELRYEDPSKGKQVAEQLLQVRLLQQDQELHQLRQQKQQAAKQQMQQQPIISTLQPPPPPHARPSGKQQQQQQAKGLHPVQRPAATLTQAWRPAAGGTAVAAGASGSSANRDRSRSKPATSREPQLIQQQQQDSNMQPESTLHTRTSSGGSGSGGGAAAEAAAGPSVMVVPRRRSLDVGSRRTEQPPPPPPPATTAAEVGIKQDTVPTAAAAEGSLLPQKQQQQYLEPTSVGQPVRESADAASVAAESLLASDGSMNAATDSFDHAAGQQTEVTAAPAVLEQPVTAAGDSNTPHNAYIHDQQQHMQAQQQQQALLLQQHSMAFAQQQAYQHVFVASGRAAALAAGQEVPPFTSEEQQLLAEWSAYYYQQAYVAASQHMQLMQTHQVQQQQHVPGAAGAGHGMDLQDAVAGSIAQQQQQDSPLQLQFGSFPVDFSMSPPDGSNSKSAQPTPNRSTAAREPAAAATMLQQQYMQPSATVPGEDAVHRWYQQRYEDMMQQQQQQPVQPDHDWQVQQQQQQPEASTQGLKENHWAQQQQQQGLPGLSGVAFLEAVVSVLQAQSINNTNSSSTTASASVLDAAADHCPTQFAAPARAALQFDARMASEFLNDRWAEIIAVYGLPQRQIWTDTTVEPAGAAAAAGEDALAVPTAAAAAEGNDLDGAEQPSCAAATASHSSRGSSSAARQRLDFTQLQQRGRRTSAGGEGRGRGRASGSSSVWRAKQR